MASQFLERSQSAEGNIDLLSTNFNSPPDTGFVVHNVATAAALAKMYAAEDILRALRSFLVKAAGGMSTGGIHTPNHRWVVCSALAQVNDVFPDAAYTRRIGQWLSEGIDIDEDGQFIERSTVTYNTVTDRAFTVMAAKLKRPELLEPVRRNLRAMVYLLHPDGEVVTEVSKRQDQFVRGTMAGYWFPVNYLAVHDARPPTRRTGARVGAGECAAFGAVGVPGTGGSVAASADAARGLRKVVRRSRPRAHPARALGRDHGPEGEQPLFQRPQWRDRDPGGALRLLVLRQGPVRTGLLREGGGEVCLSPVAQRAVLPAAGAAAKGGLQELGALRAKRRQTQVCKLEQMATVVEHKSGFELRLQSIGTPGVPVAVEINLREGGGLQGCRPAPNMADAWVLEKDFATWRVGSDTVRFGPGAAGHLLTQLRGAEAKLPGQSVYLTGYTPFDQTLRFEFGGG